jgi:Uma2 family endonuclease
MSAILNQPAVRDAVLPISVAQYHQLGEAGIIDERTELLRGVIIRKVIKSPQHSWFVYKLAEILAKQVRSPLLLRQEQPLSLADSETEPDSAIVAGTIDDFRNEHPATAKLVIEVAVSSEVLDREKTSIYAEAGVREYWLVLLQKKVVERYSGQTSAGYATCSVVGFDSTISCVCIENVDVDLTEFRHGEIKGGRPL